MLCIVAGSVGIGIHRTRHPQPAARFQSTTTSIIVVVVVATFHGHGTNLHYGASAFVAYYRGGIMRHGGEVY